MDMPATAPLLPPGAALFEGLPSRAVVLEELPPVVGDGAVVVRQDQRTGVLLIGRDQLLAVCLFSDGPRLSGEAAAAEIRTMTDATVSATRLAPDLVELLSPILLRGERCYEDLRLGWTDWHQLLADLQSRPGTFLVQIETPAGGGVTVIAEGERLATYAGEGLAEPDPVSLLDRLGGQPSGTISVHRVAAPKRQTAPPPVTPAPEPAAVEARAAPRQPDPGVAVTELLPELKLVARNRLHRSASRVERLLDDAAVAVRPLDVVIAEVRQLSIRGVLPATLEEVADGMLTVGLAHQQ